MDENIYKDKYIVRALRSKGLVGWLISNTKGRFGWSPESFDDNDINIYWFDSVEDAIAFKLVFG